MVGGGDIGAIGGFLAGGGDMTFGGDLTSKEAVTFLSVIGSGDVGVLPTIEAIVGGAGERVPDLLITDLSPGFGDPLIIIGDGFLLRATCNCAVNRSNGVTDR